MKQRSLKNQHRMLEVLLERFDAVDVTGLDAWERARAVHGRTATGLAEGGQHLASDGSAHPTRIEAQAWSKAGRPPSANPVATPLFEREEAA